MQRHGDERAKPRTVYANEFHAATMKFLCATEEKNRLALAMATHPRLGANSSLSFLPADVLKCIADEMGPPQSVVGLYESMRSFLSYGGKSYPPGDTYCMAVEMLEVYLDKLQGMHDMVINKEIRVRYEWFMPLYGALMAFLENLDEAYIAPAMGIETVSLMLVGMHDNPEEGEKMLYKTIRWSFSCERYIIYTYLQQHMALFRCETINPKDWSETDGQWSTWLGRGKKLAKESTSDEDMGMMLVF